MSDYRPKIVCFSCNFSWGYLADEDERQQAPEGLVKVICSGKIDTTHIINAFKCGADGVLVLGCVDGDCHFHNGNFQARKKIKLLQKTLVSFGIEEKRLKMVFSVDPKGSTIADIIEETRSDIVSLGPLLIVNEKAAEA